MMIDIASACSGPRPPTSSLSGVFGRCSTATFFCAAEVSASESGSSLDSDSSSDSALSARRASRSPESGASAGSISACSRRPATSSPKYPLLGSLGRDSSTTLTTAASSRNVSPKVSKPREPYTTSLTGSVRCQLGSELCIAYLATSESCWRPRGRPSSAAPNATATPAVSNRPTTTRCFGSVSMASPWTRWPRSSVAVMVRLAFLLHLTAIGHVGAHLADGDQVQRRQRDGPDDDLGVRVVRRAEHDEDEREHGADAREGHDRAVQIAQLHHEHRRRHDQREHEVVERPEQRHPLPPPPSDRRARSFAFCCSLRSTTSSRTAPCHIGTPALYAARASACDAAGLTTSSSTATSSARLA